MANTSITDDERRFLLRLPAFVLSACWVVYFLALQARAFVVPSMFHPIRFGGWPAHWWIHQQTHGLFYAGVIREHREVSAFAVAINLACLVSPLIIVAVLDGAVYKRQFTLRGMFLIMLSVAVVLAAHQAAERHNSQLEQRIDQWWFTRSWSGGQAQLDGRWNRRNGPQELCATI